MNINLSSLTESPKVTNTTVESGEATAETSESGGFFSKLASLIKGEGSAEGQVKTGEADTSQAKVIAEGETAAVEADKAAKTAATENQATDELLASDGEESGKTSKVDVKTDEPQVAVQKHAKPTSAQSPQPQSADEIMSENDEVLQRLDSANKVLQPKDGKPLPQSSEEQSASATKLDTTKVENGDKASSSDVALAKKLSEQDVEANKTLVDDLPVKAEKASEKVVMTSAEGEEVVVPASAQRFIKSSDEEPVQESETSSSATIATAKVEGEGAVERANSQSNPQVVATQSPSVESKLSTPSVSSDSSQDEALQAAAFTAATGAVVGATATSAGSEKVVDSGQTVTAQAFSATNLAAGALESEEQDQMDPTIVTATVAAGAIPWGASEGLAKDEVALKADVAPKAQQAPVAQSVHQAIVSQQSQAQLAQASQQQVVTPTMPTDIAAAQLQQVAVAPNAAMTQDQAMLKAVMGAKAAGTLGQLNSKDGAQQGSESNTNFAQQLAQASGQQGTNPITQARAEQIAQAPLQLNRELAGEQVAERVQMMMSKNLKNIDIRLDPPELGRLQIRMNMNGDAASVHFTVANQQARDVIEQSMPRLREMLAQQGVQLGDSSVQQQASGQQQRRYAESGQGNGGQGGSSQGFSGEENLEPDINLDLNVAAKRDGISYYA